jgi:hypothetical protein
MNIVHYIKTISASLREKSFHFRHALPLPENTLCHTCMPPHGLLRVLLAMLNDLIQMNPATYLPKNTHPIEATTARLN